MFMTSSVEVTVPNENEIETKGFLNIPAKAKGLVIFAHGSDSSRFSSRNQQVANFLNKKGIGTLLFDLLTEEESMSRAYVFDIPFLAKRLIAATKWMQQQKITIKFPVGYFGASTGGGAALWAAAELKHQIAAVVSRGGRPDLALKRLKEVTAPTLLLVGDRDHHVVAYNELSLKELVHAKLQLIPGATHLFEEPGTMEQVAKQAADWFLKYFAPSKDTSIGLQS